MSLEATLQANNEYLKEHNALMRELIAAWKPQTGAKAATPPKAADKPTPPAATGAALDYDKDVKPIALALAKQDVEKLRTILTKYGISKASEAKPEQYAALVKDIEAASAA